MNLLLDTHALIWLLVEDRQLSAKQRTELDRAERAAEPLAIAGISLWEIAMLVDRGRLTLPVSVDAFLADLETDPRITVLPLTARIALESTRLGPGFHRDPVDRMITATARAHALRLVTADAQIRASGVVAVV